MKVRDLITILSEFDPDSEISVERTRRSAVAGVVEVDLLDPGIKQFNVHDTSHEMPRRSYAIYATTISGNGASPQAESSSAVAAAAAGRDGAGW